MMTYVARKPMVLMGVQYAPRETVPLGGLRPGLRQRLVDMRRVVPRGNQALPGPSPVVTKTELLTCGDHGGRSKNGRPCGKTASDNGPCRWHRAPTEN